MIPLKLRLHNFLCYRDPGELDLRGVHVACLCGDNGHGKSALLDAITWSLWGWARGKRYGQGGSSPNELVTQGQADLEVSFDFLVDSSSYRVVRKYSKGIRGRSNATILDLEIDTGSGYYSLSEGSVQETEREVQRRLHMDYETFINSAFLLQGQADRFTTSTPAHRKEVLAEILGLSLYERVQGRAREAARARAGQIALLHGEGERLRAELDREPEYREALAAAQAVLTDLEPRIEELGRQRQSLQEELRLLQRRREESVRLDQDLRRALDDLDTLGKQAQDGRRRVDSYRSLLARRQEIEAGELDRESTRRLLEALDADQTTHAALSQERQRLQHQVVMAQSALETELRHVQQRVDADLLPRSQRLSQVEEDLNASAQNLRQLQTREDGLQEPRRELQDAAGQAQTLESDNKRLRADMDELRGKLDMLTAADAACPLCGTPLGADGRGHLQREIQGEGEKNADAFRANRRTLAQLAQRRGDLEQALAREEAALAQARTQLLARQGALERELEEVREAQGQLEVARRQARQLEDQLRAQAFAQEPRQALGGVEAQLGALGYDPAQHREMRTRAGELEEYRDLARQLTEASQRLPQEEGAASEMEKLLEARRLDAQEARARMDSISQALESLPALQAEAGEREAEHLRLETQYKQAQQDAHLHTVRLEELDRARQRLADLAAQAAAADQEREAYELLVDAFGQRGVQALLIEAALPELEDEANALLARLTDNRMALTLETQRQSRRGDVTETLEVRIADELGTRSYELFSGGEAFRINFALRIALAKLLTSRSGAPLRSLFLDEGFGTQDAQGRERLVDAIHSIQDEFDLIMVITHIEELKEAFPLRIEVTKTEEAGSTFELVWN